VLVGFGFFFVVKIFCKFAETLVSVIFTIVFEPKIVEQKALKNLLVYFCSSELKKIRSFL